MRISDWSSDVCSSDLYRIVDRATLAQTLFLHQCDQRLQPVFERVGIAQHSALMAKGCIRDEPALAPLADDMVHRDPHIGEERLVELGVTGTRLKGANLDARRAHRQDQVGNPAMLWFVRDRKSVG